MEQKPLVICIFTKLFPLCQGIYEQHENVKYIRDTGQYYTVNAFRYRHKICKLSGCISERVIIIHKYWITKHKRLMWHAYRLYAHTRMHLSNSAFANNVHS